MQTDQVTMHVVRRAGPDERVVVCSLLRVPHDPEGKKRPIFFYLVVDSLVSCSGCFQTRLESTKPWCGCISSISERKEPDVDRERAALAVQPQDASLTIISFRTLTSSFSLTNKNPTRKEVRSPSSILPLPARNEPDSLADRRVIRRGTISGTPGTPSFRLDSKSNGYEPNACWLMIPDLTSSQRPPSMKRPFPVQRCACCA
ncbi:hypothetical protein V8F33_005433 [Rhypophila sp. PSN 637]